MIIVFVVRASFWRPVFNFTVCLGDETCFFLNRATPPPQIQNTKQNKKNLYIKWNGTSYINKIGIVAWIILLVDFYEKYDRQQNCLCIFYWPLCKKEKTESECMKACVIIFHINSIVRPDLWKKYAYDTQHRYLIMTFP